MTHLDLIASNIPVQPLLLALARQPELWNQYTYRTTYPGSVHAEVSDILVRFQEVTPEATLQSVTDEHETMPYTAWWLLPEAKGLALMLLSYVQGVRLGRVIITKLGPGKKILPHVDSAPHSTYYTRYQVCLQSATGCWIRAGDEVVEMRQGEVWHLDNAVEHEVQNQSDEDRIVLIVDVHRDNFPVLSTGAGGAG